LSYLGETIQLQWELQRRDVERAALTAELTSLTTQLEEKDEVLSKSRHIEITLGQLQRNYDALLQMHGEKVEEVEELRLDLQDVKEMYKAQVLISLYFYQLTRRLILKRGTFVLTK